MNKIIDGYCRSLDALMVIALAVSWWCSSSVTLYCATRSIPASRSRRRSDKTRVVMASAEEKSLANLKAAGLTFNTVDVQPFRQVLQKAGFYADWKKKFSPMGGFGFRQFVLPSNR